MKSQINQIKKQSGNLGAQLARWVIRRRWLVLITSLATVMAFFMGASKLGFDSDYRVFFKKDNPQLQAYEALQRKYTQDDNVLIVIEPKNGETFTPKNLAALEELTDSAWQTPYSTRVDAITNYQYTHAEGDELYVEDLVEQAQEKNQSEVNKLKEIALDEPLLVKRLLSEDGTISAINITVKFPGESITENPEVITYVRDMVLDFESKHPQLKTHLSGLVMLNGAFFEASQSDAGSLIPLMFLAIVLTIFLATRTISGTISTLIVIVFSIIVAMGFAGFVGIKLTPPSSSAPIIIMTLAVADSIHVLISMMQGMRRGLGKREAIVESLRINFLPVFITSLTTVIGFLSMNTSEVPPFHDLGNITAVGMVAAFVFSVTVLPAFMVILPVKVKVQASTDEPKNGFYGRIANFVIQQRSWVLAGSMAFIGLFTAFALNSELNDEFIKYFDQSVSFRKDTDFINERLTGIYNAEFSLGSGEPGGINNPAYLEQLEAFEKWLEEQPEVVHVNSYAEISRQINQSMHGDSLAYYRIPNNREEAAQYLLMYEFSLPFGLDLNNQINVDKSETRLIATIQNIPTRDMITFVKRAEGWLQDNAPEAMFSYGISPTMMFAYVSSTQIQSMILGTVVALLLISCILMLALKSFPYGMLSLLPNVAPAMVGFGAWYLIGGQINIGISIVFGMTLGIIVDDTIHFLMKYLRARREYGYSAENAIHYAFATVGRALVVTTLVLVAGFIILSQSSFGMNSGMAKVTSLVISAALIIDFLMLPALLLLFSQQGRKAPLAKQAA